MAGPEPEPTQRQPIDIAAELEAEGFENAREVGHGGFGVVYGCRQPSLDRTVAIKVLTSDLDHDAVERFVREQQAMGRLSGHPNIVNILQVGVTRTGRPYLVMPYHRQDSLDVRIRRDGPLPLPEALHVGVRLAGALETAHRAGILHRDVKPANVLVTEYGEPQLADFGIARVPGGFHTAAGAITASPAFTAPEVLTGESPSVASDVYGLGTLLFCAITGHTPFERREGEQVVAQFLRITTEQVPDLRPTGMPDSVCAALERAMAQNPADRYSSAQEFGGELREAQRRNGWTVDEMALPTDPSMRKPADTSTQNRAAGVGMTPRPHRAAHAPVTSFVGRRRELAAAKSAMTESRLVTLTGPGGVGKTRLAYELADRSRKSFRDGVWVVDLASIGEGSLLAPTVASALAVPDQSNREATSKLVDHLCDRQILVVLDNCEHLLQPVATLVDELLGRSPGLRILATSREPLAIAGEYVGVIPPLSTPPLEGHCTPRAIEHFESVKLLTDRARSITPDFSITDENAGPIVQLCNRLDGIPLAIELAATRLRALSVTQIVERLDRRFQLLTGGSRAALPRQQTLRALIDWSYDLCTNTEQLLWARLSVFTSSFDLEAAEHVCGFGALHPDTVIDHLDRLVAKSILVTERDGEIIRYRQLMTVREYGAELLMRSGGYSTVRRRHRDHYLRRAASMVERWAGPGQADALAAMRRDHPNLMSALEWSTATAEELGAAAELASLLRYHWIAGGFLSNGRRWLQKILRSLDTSNPQRGEALWVAAWVALIQGDRDAAWEWLSECDEFATRHDDPRLAAHVAQWTAEHRMFSGEAGEATTLLSRALEGHVEIGDLAPQLMTLFQLAMVQTYAGSHTEALQTCDTALKLSVQHGERWAHAYTLWIQGVSHWHLGNNDQAQRDALTALTLQRDFKDSICTALSIELLAWIAASTSNFQEAGELAAAAGAVWTGLGTSVAAFGPHIHRDSTDCTKKVATALGPKRASELLVQHANLQKDAAIDLAIRSAQPGKLRQTKREGKKTSPLTKRELEIAQLVSKGLSNRAIAETLVLSTRTIDGHVERIFAKLDFTSRTQIASWIAYQTAEKPQ